MRYLFFLIFFSVFSLSFGQAQTPSGDKVTGKPPLAIADRLSAIEHTLKTVQQTLDKPDNSAQITAKLADLELSATVVDKKIAALSAADTPPINLSQIKSMEHTKHQLADWRNSLMARQSTLNKVADRIEATETALKSIEQLLSNPMQQDNVSVAKTAQVTQFNSYIIDLSHQIVTQQLETETLLIQLDDTSKQLSRLKSALANTLAAQQSEQQLNTHSEKKRLSDNRKTLENNIVALQNKLQDQRSELSLTDIETLQQQIYSKQTQAWLLAIDQQLVEILTHKTVVVGLDTTLKDLSAEQLAQQDSVLDKMQKALLQLKASVDKRYQELQQYNDIIGAQPLLDEAFSKRLQAIAYQQLLLNNQEDRLNKEISRAKQAALLTRDYFYSQKQWQAGGAGLKDAILQIVYQINISFRTLYQHIVESPFQTALIAALAILIQLGLLRLMAYWVRLGIRGRRDDTGVIVTLRKLLLVIRKYSYFYIFLLFIITLVDVTEIPDPSNQIINTLVYVSAFALTWWNLVRIEVKLGNLSVVRTRYTNAITLLLLLCVLLYVLSYESAVSAAVVGLCEKLLLLMTGVFTWVLRKTMTTYLSQQKEKINKKVYHFYVLIFAALSWLVVAVCIIGLAGYGRLAWLILAYLGAGVLYMLSVVVGIAVLNLARKTAKMYCLKRFTYGGFIAQDIVSPLAFIIKLLWLFFTARLWFMLQGWNSNSYLIAKFLAIVRYPLVTIGQTPITLQTIALILLAVYIIFRAGRWLKTFSYHWLYARVSDLGVRSSLSIFSQYVAILSGVLIAMNVLGIDLTSLAVFAGALGVGVGLGLQDIAKNFISGILLLIERPLRSGDWVSIDNMEGTVKSIGMRAITVETFNKQEVIIPNGHAINNSVTNYTHNNSVTRTVLYVGAAYDCPPAKVLGILATVLNDNPDTLKDPAPAAILWEYADSAINYRIQYYIDLNKSGLFSVRTAVLRSVWEAFADNNIEIPFPQRDIHFRNAMLMAAAKQPVEPASPAEAETVADPMKNQITADKINTDDNESEE